nr:hypothetical protein [Pandoraea bronchicola]
MRSFAPRLLKQLGLSAVPTLELGRASVKRNAVSTFAMVQRTQRNRVAVARALAAAGKESHMVNLDRTLPIPKVPANDATQAGNNSHVLALCLLCAFASFAFERRTRERHCASQRLLPRQAHRISSQSR